MQDLRGPIFIGLAIIMGLAAAWVTQDLVSSSAPDDLQTKSVVVLRIGVPVATSLTKKHLTTAQWPAEHIPPGAVTSVDQGAGRIVRRPLAAGEPILESSLFDVGASGGLLAVISPEYRAVTVKVDSVIGVAGFVSPGARVDVMATLHRVDHDRALPYSKTILQNIRVLAIDQQLEELNSGSPKQVSVVTLEVDPAQAERLVYAAHEGRLQFAMRSPGDDTNVKTKSVGVAEVLGERIVAKARKVSGRRVQVINGANLRTERF